MQSLVFVWSIPIHKFNNESRSVWNLSYIAQITYSKSYQVIICPDSHSKATQSVEKWTYVVNKTEVVKSIPFSKWAKGVFADTKVWKGAKWPKSDNLSGSSCEKKAKAVKNRQKKLQNGESGEKCPKAAKTTKRWQNYGKLDKNKKSGY